MHAQHAHPSPKNLPKFPSNRYMQEVSGNNIATIFWPNSFFNLVKIFFVRNCPPCPRIALSQNYPTPPYIIWVEMKYFEPNRYIVAGLIYSRSTQRVKESYLLRALARGGSSKIALSRAGRLAGRLAGRWAITTDGTLFTKNVPTCFSLRII